MTREEAIEFIAQSVKSDVDMALVADAIKALEQEPTTKNDFISRQAVINEMEKRHAEGDYITKGFIKNLPSVTPQESILDEIRDKIQAIYIGNRNGYGIMADVLKIIDKYRTESEDNV